MLLSYHVMFSNIQDKRAEEKEEEQSLLIVTLSRKSTRSRNSSKIGSSLSLLGVNNSDFSRRWNSSNDVDDSICCIKLF